MPIFRSDEKLIYYAHVPKCGGSSIATYLGARFGGLAFHDNGYLSVAEDLRWTRSSPQHVDRTALGRLFPEGFFDASFTIVRHPVDRLVSAYHFQLEVEKSTALGFSDWLAAAEAAAPFAWDNHARPMDEIVPEGAAVFRLEEGLAGLVTWLDAVTGRTDGPREIPRSNERGAFTGVSAPKAQPSEADLARIARVYAADFARFGYDVDRPMPVRAPASARKPSLIGRLRRRIGR